MTKKNLTEIISALLALLFIYAAISKVIDMPRFRFQLGRAPYFGRFADGLAIILPVTELIIVALLYLPKTRLAGLWSSFVSMLVFTLYVSLLLATGKHLPCTCGGLIQQLTWPQHLVFNIGFTAIAFIGIICYKKQEFNDGVSSRNFHFAKS